MMDSKKEEDSYRAEAAEKVRIYVNALSDAIKVARKDWGLRTTVTVNQTYWAEGGLLCDGVEVEITEVKKW